METRRVVLHFVLLLLATRTSDSASIERIFPVDGTIMLTPNPPVTEMITRIVWKHGVNLLAEGMDGKLYYFNRFTGRATLNITNGVLTVTNARLSDSASYEVEVNNKIQELRYDVKVIREVPKPSVSPKPLTCGPKSDRCDLTCEGDTSGAEPVSYSWMKGGVEWNQQAKKVEIKNTKDMAGVKTFSCEMKNNVSSKQSDPIDNPFLKKDTVGGGGVWYKVGVTVVCILVVIGIVGVGFWQKDNIMSLLNKGGGHGNAAQSGDVDTQPSTTLSVTAPLNSTQEV